MTKIKFSALLTVLFMVALAACNDEQAAAPKPQELNRDCIGYYCNMFVADHPGPKAHIYLRGELEPVWFTSVRDAIAYTMLPEEPRSIMVVYVTDMAKASNWEKPGNNTWMEAKDAWYVIGSSKRGGMGAAEAVPFSDKTSAKKFTEEFGGLVVEYEGVKPNYIFGDVDAQQANTRDHRGM